MTTPLLAEMFIVPWPIAVAVTLGLVALVGWRIYKDRLGPPGPK